MQYQTESAAHSSKLDFHVSTVSSSKISNTSKFSSSLYGKRCGAYKSCTREVGVITYNTVNSQRYLVSILDLFIVNKSPKMQAIKCVVVGDG